MRDVILWVAVALLVSCTAFRDHSPGQTLPDAGQSRDGRPGSADEGGGGVVPDDAALDSPDQGPNADPDMHSRPDGADPDQGVPSDAAPDETDQSVEPDLSAVDAAPADVQIVTDAMTSDGPGSDLGDAATDADALDGGDADVGDAATDADTEIPEGGLEE